VQPVSDSDLSAPIPVPVSPVPDLNVPAAAVVAHMTDFFVTLSVIVTFPDCFPVKDPPGETSHPAVAAMDDAALNTIASAVAPAASRTAPGRVRMRFLPRSMPALAQHTAMRRRCYWPNNCRRHCPGRLELLDEHRFRNGVVHLHYAVRA
jgi:hypothetical protein